MLVGSAAVRTPRPGVSRDKFVFSGLWRPEARGQGLQGWLPARAFLPACPHVTLRQRARARRQRRSRCHFPKDTGSAGSGSPTMTSRDLSYFLMGPVAAHTATGVKASAEEHPAHNIPPSGPQNAGPCETRNTFTLFPTPPKGLDPSKV